MILCTWWLIIACAHHGRFSLNHEDPICNNLRMHSLVNFKVQQLPKLLFIKKIATVAKNVEVLRISVFIFGGGRGHEFGTCWTHTKRNWKQLYYDTNWMYIMLLEHKRLSLMHTLSYKPNLIFLPDYIRAAYCMARIQMTHIQTARVLCILLFSLQLPSIFKRCKFLHLFYWV